MKKTILVTLFAMISMSFANAGSNPTLQTVDYVDINKYMGTWYEIAKLPNKFQKKCISSRATYSLKKNGSVKVLNVCTTAKNNKLKKAKGTAFVADTETNSKLKVGLAPLFRYFGWFTGDYYIIDLADDYSYALVGEPSRKFLWILSRTKVLDESIYDELLDIAAQRGFNISKVVKSPIFNH